MYKIFTSILTTLLVGLFVTVATAYAALSVRVEQPKSPNNVSSLDVTFVALDTENKSVTVKCYKKGPTDGGFSQVGGDKVLSNGGNTDKCNFTSLNDDGNYQFYVTADNGSELKTSNTVSVDIKRSSPGTPVDYSKEKITSCEYKIHFKTANDSGKTVRVEIYRSDSKSFGADAGSRVGNISIGSDTQHDFVQSVPDCNKTYYYVVRAFDDAGNGSGLEGDKEVTTHVTNPTTTPAQGAIPVSGGSSNQGGTGGSVLGSDTNVTPTGEEKTEDETKDSEEANSDADKGVQGAATSSWFTPGKIAGAALIAVVLAFVYWYLRRKK